MLLNNKHSENNINPISFDKRCRQFSLSFKTEKHVFIIIFNLFFILIYSQD